MTIDPNGLAFTNAGGSLLDAGRRINRSGIGISQSSRQLLESFYSSGTGLFNTLYTAAENQEVNNRITILALRSKLNFLVSDSIKSQTSGNNVDTSA